MEPHAPVRTDDSATLEISLGELARSFIRDTTSESAGLQLTPRSVHTFAASLLSKRFLILTGLAGSGKTKIAQAFARWITDDTQPERQYVVVPVGADWTSNENVLGYPHGLDDKAYVTKPALEIALCATAKPHIPHFLILDEMNLSHVERYFADVLSAVESQEPIPLYEGEVRQAKGREIPRQLRLPENLFIIGTVNVDETTYQFSPKVLDRANVMEFRMTLADMDSFLTSPKAAQLSKLDGRGVHFANEFVKAAVDAAVSVPPEVEAHYKEEMLLLFSVLREHNAEFGYRVGYEAARLLHFQKLLGEATDADASWFTDAMDTVIVQKILPKLHGSRAKLEGLLWALIWLCGPDRVVRKGISFIEQLAQASLAQDEMNYGPEVVWQGLLDVNPEEPTQASHYPLSLEKLMRMWRRLIRDQFVTFAEA